MLIWESQKLQVELALINTPLGFITVAAAIQSSQASIGISLPEGFLCRLEPILLPGAKELMAPVRASKRDCQESISPGVRVPNHPQR